MATVKAYSVANTQGGGDGDTSTVYSVQLGRQQSYDHSDDQNMQEGRRKTLVNGGRSPANHDVTDLGNATVAGTARADLASKVVVATTSTVVYDSSAQTYEYPTSDGDYPVGAGLIVKFTVAANGALPAFGTGSAGSTFTGDNFVIVDGGEGYATGDTVTIDGWNDSVVEVTAA